MVWVIVAYIRINSIGLSMAFVEAALDNTTDFEVCMTSTS
jgi:hypothetical protein